MRIDILTIGSRGDVLPTVALGLGLQRAGHDVRMVTQRGYEELIRAYGLGHLSIGGSLHDIETSDAGRDWLMRRANPIAFARGFGREMWSARSATSLAVT